MGGIPEGWLDYSKMGKPMKSDKSAVTFVSFKVPLKHQLTSRLPEEEVFTPSDLLAECEQKNINLKMIIDLTFTSRYYQSNEFEQAGVEYMKIPIEGQMVPKKARFEKFAETVKNFMQNPENKDGVIGVHCTHGLNRTGYIICKYLIDNENLKPDEAIELFNSCRGHSMERENYLNHLLKGDLPESEKDSYHDGKYNDSKWNRGNVLGRGQRGSRHVDDSYRNYSSYGNYYKDDNYSGYNHYSDYDSGYGDHDTYNYRRRGACRNWGYDDRDYYDSRWSGNYNNRSDQYYYSNDYNYESSYSNYSSFEHSAASSSRTGRSSRDHPHSHRSDDRDSYSGSDARYQHSSRAQSNKYQQDNRRGQGHGHSSSQRYNKRRNTDDTNYDVSPTKRKS